MDTEKAHLLALRKKIDELSYQYYTLDKPTVTDYEYDMMYRELENIEKAHPDWVTPDSPTQRVGSKISGGFEKYTHDRPMLSLGDVFSDDELREFDQRVIFRLGIVVRSCKDVFCIPNILPFFFDLRKIIIHCKPS